MSDKMMSISLYKTKENSLLIRDVKKVSDENGFLAECYENAHRSAIRYLQQSDSLRKEITDCDKGNAAVNELLYRSPHNIIAFSGKRGTGKTSTMLSFAYSLNNNLYDDMSDRGFVSLNPIDPTMLENRQNILNIVLSRLMYKIEETWNSHNDAQKDYIDTMGEKDKLLKNAAECLSGIQSVKYGDEIRSLQHLQEVGDSAVLKTSLFRLIEDVNSFCLPESYRNKNNILIIPIDDTDCQIEKGYDVMEDIRRYLTLPNVLILMATDIDILQQVFIQSFAESFADNIRQGVVNIDEIGISAEKYLSKMIPPAYKIYLPLADDLIRRGEENLDVKYYNNENDTTDLLGNGTGFQSRILNYLFEKTHLFFSVHESYCNNIIPQTLRGLTYFLNMISEMMDVPVNPNANEDYIDFLIRKNESIENNLNIFESYFVHEWAPAKLHSVMRKLIEEVSDQIAENRIIYAYEKLAELYKVNTKPEERLLGSYYNLDKLTRTIVGTVDIDKSAIGFLGAKHGYDDYYNVFAIRTIIGILNAIDIIHIRLKHLREMKKNQHMIIGVNYRRSARSLPESFYFSDEELPVIINPDDMSDDISIDTRMYGDMFMSGFFETLKGNLPTELSNEEIYTQQEIACIVSCSWEAQDRLRKIIRARRTDEDFRIVCQNNEVSGPEKIYRTVFWLLSAENDKMMNGFMKSAVRNEKNWQTFMRCDESVRTITDVIHHYISRPRFRRIGLLLSLLPENFPKSAKSQGETRSVLREITSALRMYADNTDKGNDAPRLADKCEHFCSMDFDADPGVMRKNYRDLISDLRAFNAD